MGGGWLVVVYSPLMRFQVCVCVCVGCVCTVRTDECDEAVKGPDGDVE